MRDDDRDDPFDEFFDEIERMMNEMMGPNANFHFEHNSGRAGESDHGGHDVHLDIHERDDEIRVVADIPGVEKEAIDLQCDGETLQLDAGNGERRYSERISLPGRVDEHSASATYNNGVLEVVFERLDDSTSIDV
ncbi:Hsp20 family protein [Halovenus sp. WSH3]|uniref:Hsp20 family protein n=1 Tax=Halovenus carboxidivorans TaxID=2692199 RepID=A0A6B0TB68_9EURY|nr:Hsp20/alpha crystallin family protein [Halovenus carboxidivorans]MXR52461.1 Hsp20 family protein [Halovenus carboxidivorans]